MAELAQLKKQVIPSHGVEVQFNEVALAMTEPSGTRPRVYAYLVTGEFKGQIVKITSSEKLKAYELMVGFYWVTQFDSPEQMIRSLVNRAP